MLGGYLGTIDTPQKPVGAVAPAEATPSAEEIKELNLRLQSQEQYKQYGLLLGAVSVGMKVLGMWKGK